MLAPALAEWATVREHFPCYTFSVIVMARKTVSNIVRLRSNSCRGDVSLGWVSPRAATEGVTLFFFLKKLTTFF